MPVIFVAATSVIFALVTAPSVMVVAFPIDVTGPVKLAFVVTVLAVVAVVAVAALPAILPNIGLVTVKLVKVPTLVKLELVIVDFKVVPVKVPASAVTVTFSVPSNATPLIVLAVANLVANPAIPVTLSSFASSAACVAVETGLSTSLVLSTFNNPTIALVIPLTVPVKVGDSIFAFKLMALKYGLSIAAVSAIFSLVSAPFTLPA